MSKDKNSKIEAKSNKEENLKSFESKRLLSFDAYFSKLVMNKKALPHHKAPMKLFAEQKGLIEAGEEEFDKVFETY